MAFTLAIGIGFAVFGVLSAAVGITATIKLVRFVQQRNKYGWLFDDYASLFWGVIFALICLVLGVDLFVGGLLHLS